MKKFTKMLGILLAAVLSVALFAVFGCSSTKSESSSSTSSSSSITATESMQSEPETPQSKIEAVITDRIKDKFNETDIDKITINNDAGADSGYIALVNLTWNVKNSADTSKKMLSLYSEDLAATVGNECPDVNEIAVFWDVPYLDGNAKVSYERKGSGMALSDQAWTLGK